METTFLDKEILSVRLTKDDKEFIKENIDELTEGLDTSLNSRTFIMNLVNKSLTKRPKEVIKDNPEHLKTIQFLADKIDELNTRQPETIEVEKIVEIPAKYPENSILIEFEPYEKHILNKYAESESAIRNTLIRPGDLLKMLFFKTIVNGPFDYFRQIFSKSQILRIRETFKNPENESV